MNNLPKQERLLNRIYCFYSAKCKFCVLICMQFRSFLWHWWNVMERAGIKRGEEKGRKIERRKQREVSPKGQLERTIVRESRLAWGCCFSPHPCHGTLKYSRLWATSISHHRFQGAAPIPKVPASCLGRHKHRLGKAPTPPARPWAVGGWLAAPNSRARSGTGVAHIPMGSWLGFARLNGNLSAVPRAGGSAHLGCDASVLL